MVSDRVAAGKLQRAACLRRVEAPRQSGESRKRLERLRAEIREHAAACGTWTASRPGLPTHTRHRSTYPAARAGPARREPAPAAAAATASSDSGPSSRRLDAIRPDVARPSASTSKRRSRFVGAIASAVALDELEAARGQRAMHALLLPGDASRQMREVQRRQLAREPRADVGELEIRDHVAWRLPRRTRTRPASRPGPDCTSTGIGIHSDQAATSAIVEAQIDAPGRACASPRTTRPRARRERRSARRSPAGACREGRTGDARSGSRAGSGRRRGAAAARCGARRSTRAARRARRSVVDEATNR